MSIIRVGLSETKGFSEGYDAIFGKKEKKEEQAEVKTKEEPKPETPKEPSK